MQRRDLIAAKVDVATYFTSMSVMSAQLHMCCGLFASKEVCAVTKKGKSKQQQALKLLESRECRPACEHCQKRLQPCCCTPSGLTPVKRHTNPEHGYEQGEKHINALRTQGPFVLCLHYADTHTKYKPPKSSENYRPLPSLLLTWIYACQLLFGFLVNSRAPWNGCQRS